MNDIEQSNLKNELKIAVKDLKKINLHITDKQNIDIVKKRNGKLQKVLIANRGEIAKRFFLSLHEEGIRTVAVVTDVDKGQSWYDFADEVVFIGEHYNYSNPYVIIAATQLISANAIYSGYGFLSENSTFVKIIDLLNNVSIHKIIFMGPSYDSMHLMGDKISARDIASVNNIPLFESSEVFVSKDMSSIKNGAEKIGYPVMVKLTSGGGGKGMLPVFSEDQIEVSVDSCIRTGLSLYNNPSFYLEKFIVKPIHIEVQIFNGWVIGIRKCAVQRRNQKIIEESGELFLDDYTCESMISIAEKIAELSGYSRSCGAGTIEFLIDQETGKFGFLEMNTRLQVEYAVTDQSLDIDIVKYQIQLYDGRENEFGHLANPDHRLFNSNHAIECRIYAEDPENDYHPSPGVITELDLPTFNGIRCDFGFKEGDRILSMYDPMIGKLIVHGRTRNEAIIRLERALQELYIKGVKTNISQLLRIIRHQDFINGSYNNNFLSMNKDVNPVLSGDAISDRVGNVHVIMGAFAEYLRLFNLNVSEFIVISRIKSIINSPLPDICTDFKIEYLGRSYDIKILQTTFNTYNSFINQEHTGSIILKFSNEHADNIIVNSGNRLLRIRVDRKSDSISLRMKDDSNKINYYNMKIQSAGSADKSNTGIIRSPFQGTVISLCKNLKPGDIISAGEPLIILSSMKMETTISADAGGKIIYIISGSDNSQSGNIEIAGEKKKGRSIQEGEILFKIEENSRRLKSDIISDEKDALKVFSNNFQISIIENPENFIHAICEVFFALICGYMSQDYIIEMIQRIVVEVKFIKWKTLLTDSLTDLIEKAILHYTYIKQLFSPSVTEEGISFYDELNNLILKWNEEDVYLSRDFNTLIIKILKSYGYSDDIDISMNPGKIQLKKVILYLKFSYQFISDHPEFVKYLIYILPHINIPNSKILEIINLFEKNEQSEKDDSLTKYIKKIMYEKSPHHNSEYQPADEHKISGLKFIAGYPEINTENFIQTFCKVSLGKPEKNLIPFNLSYLQKSELETKIIILQRKHDVERLNSPIANVYIYRLKSLENSDSSYISFVFINDESIGLSDKYNIIEKAIHDSMAVLYIYQIAEQYSQNWIHILISGAAILLNDNDLQDDYKMLSYGEIKQKCSAALNMIKKYTQLKGIIECSIQSPNQRNSDNKKLLFYTEMDKTVFEFLSDSDVRNPYSNLENYNKIHQRLFNINKWPVDIWAEECFDSGIFDEIKIESVDYYEDAQCGNILINNVGAKIFVGRINNEETCFFMKDSRINSGSTGDLEGLKYSAASYLSLLKGWPFFVWNDGAGANIKEGIISLNRGAQGFMMNTLHTSNDKVKFKQFVLNNPDPILKSLFKSIDKQFDLSIDSIKTNFRPLSLIAVGIGSSAGLDVYGSSQAVLQVMLDSDQSYRVLTGSSVIKSIIGEDITNYEIGGAKIICKLTGIADIMVSDKIHLIKIIRQIHKYFYSECQLTSIKRKGQYSADEAVKNNDIRIITEDIVKSNVDDSEFIELKKDYYESNSLLGGFAKIGGERVLIIGARTHDGLRSYESIIKGRELLKIAQRTSSNEIIIFGKEWIQLETSEDNSHISKLDFMNTLQNKSGLRIHIVTHIEGLKLYYINNTADVIIFIEKDKNKITERSLIKKNSTFVMSSFEEAFNLSHKLINLFNRSQIKNDTAQPHGTPCIPSDSSTPFDMITSVIIPVFDTGSFVEFYSEMNNPETGPTLITGLARLNGITVGIIADQPLQKGGAADAYGTEKFRIFTQLLNSRKIPLIMLSNSSGFMPGSKQESLRIQAIGAESLEVNILGEIPVVSIVFNQNYGGRLIHAFNKFLRPGIVYLAFADSVLAVIGVKVAFDLLNKKNYDKLIEAGKISEAGILKDEFYKNYLYKSKGSSDGISTNLVDWIISDIKELRSNIIKGLDLAIQRCKDTFLI